MQRHTVSSLACLPPALLASVSLSPTFTFTTGVIDQLVYWWLEEVEEAVEPVVYITAYCGFTAALLPLIAYWWSKQKTLQRIGSLESLPALLPVRPILF